jgi:hypothetical protein
MLTRPDNSYRSAITAVAHRVADVARLRVADHVVLSRFMPGNLDKPRALYFATHERVTHCSQKELADADR